MSSARTEAILTDARIARFSRNGERIAERAAVTARLGVVRAYSHGGDLFAPIIALEAAIIDAATRASVVADLHGRVSSAATAAAHLSRNKRTAFSIREAAADFLARRAALSKAEVDALSRRYGDQAARSAAQVRGKLERAVTEAMERAVREGAHVWMGVRYLREAFDKAGAGPQSKHALETLFRTETQKAYSAGEWEADSDPAIAEVLWGYEYMAIEDDRTTELCEDLDGTRRPRNDPFWSTYWPPNHYNCRSRAVKVFNGDVLARMTRVPKGVKPFPGFDVNFGEIPQLEAA